MITEPKKFLRMLNAFEKLMDIIDKESARVDHLKILREKYRQKLEGYL